VEDVVLQITICLLIAGVKQPLAALTAVAHCPPCFAVHTSPTGYFHGGTEILLAGGVDGASGRPGLLRLQ